MAEYIDRGRFKESAEDRYCKPCKEEGKDYNGCRCRACWVDDMIDEVDCFQTADVAPVVHGRWILEVHYERVNYRWNVTAECSECCDEQKEIWAGFFPNVPPPIARDLARVSAERVKLSNYCPACGAKMDGGEQHQ